MSEERPAEARPQFEDICPRCLEAFPVSGDACVGGSFCPKCRQFSVYAELKLREKSAPAETQERQPWIPKAAERGHEGMPLQLEAQSSPETPAKEQERG